MSALSPSFLTNSIANVSVTLPNFLLTLLISVLIHFLALTFGEELVASTCYNFLFVNRKLWMTNGVSKSILGASMI
jgi:hypothetical protein